MAPEPTAPIRWIERFASPWITALFFIVTALAAYAVARLEVQASMLMAVPFGLLVLNLWAAIVALPRFRHDLPLLIFHLALVALVALWILARLTYFQGSVSLAVGETFRSPDQLVKAEAGQLHRQPMAGVEFTNLGFEEYYPRPGSLLYTRNAVQWRGDNGQQYRSEIEQGEALLIAGYRIYTTYTRGYAPVLRWVTNTGEQSYGRVHLTNAVDRERPPTNEWQLPNGPLVWAMLDQGGETPADFAPTLTPQPSRNAKAAELDHTLVLRIDGQRHELRPGDSIQLAAGELSYVKLEAWMGYFINSDPTRPWLIATVMIAIVSLCWFYSRRLFKQSWDSDR